MQRETETFSSDSTIGAVLDAHPASARVLMRQGMACVGCTMAAFETLAEASREYRLNPGALLEELKLACANGRRSSRGAGRYGRAPGTPQHKSRKR